MKILLTTLNAKYIHTALALHTLRSYAAKYGYEAIIREFTINQPLDWILGQIVREEPDLVGVSCNIWNIEVARVLVRRLKMICPNLLVVLGGPEVTPDPEGILLDSRADYAVLGEGEEPFRLLLAALKQGDSPDGLPGLAARRGEQVCWTPPGPPLALAEIPFPYDHDALREPGRIIYYETSRGCPFSCAYCLSGQEEGVRYLPVERVFGELDMVVAAGVRQVKLVDRTFNVEPRRTAAILQYILEKHGAGGINFHLELVAEILNEETIRILNQAPPGLFRVEIGIQSLNPPTLRAIHRRVKPEVLAEKVQKLLAPGNIPVHLDLIAGLPEEGMAEFARTFDWTYRLHPDELQLGILKLLKGSELGQTGRAMGYLAEEEAPYEVLITPWLGFAELQHLKTMAKLVESYHNAGHFRHALPNLLEAKGRSPFLTLSRFTAYWQERSCDAVSHSLKELFRILLEAAEEILLTETGDKRIFKDLLRLDRALADWGYDPQVDDWSPAPEPADHWREELSDQEWVTKNLPELACLAPNDRRRRVRTLRLSVDPKAPWEDLEESGQVLLVYRPVTGRIRYKIMTI